MQHSSHSLGLPLGGRIEVWRPAYRVNLVMEVNRKFFSLLCVDCIVATDGRWWHPLSNPCRFIHTHLPTCLSLFLFQVVHTTSSPSATSSPRHHHQHHRHFFSSFLIYLDTYTDISVPFIGDSGDITTYSRILTWAQRYCQVILSQLAFGLFSFVNLRPFYAR